MSQFGGGANPFGAPSGMGGNPYEQPQQQPAYGGYDQQTGGYGMDTGGYGQDTSGYGQDATYGQQTGVQQPYGTAARPRVDIDAEGVVDPTL